MAATEVTKVTKLNVRNDHRNRTCMARGFSAHSTITIATLNSN